MAEIDVLAQAIRVADGNHDLGAGALAEALMPTVRSLMARAWDEGVARDAKYGGGYLRALYAVNPYRHSPGEES